MENKKPADACPSCLLVYESCDIVAEAIQPLPEVCPPRNYKNQAWCHDCASAETLVRFKYVPTWAMARTAVGNDRHEQYRLPGFPMGLVKLGIVRPSQPGDMDKQHDWLVSIGFEPWEYGMCDDWS